MAQANQLSSREQEVVKLLLEGKSNKLIASALHISDRTVEFHLKNIYAKLQVSSRTELIIKLGNSTVASQGEVTENRDTLNLRNWAASLKKTVSRIGKELKMKVALNPDTHDEGGPLTFFESIRVCFSKYAEFNGRASRSEFWWFTLFVVLVTSALVYVHEVLGQVFLIAVLLPFLAAGARRLHDIGKSAWWLLFLLAPVAGIVLLGFFWAEPPLNALPDDTTPA